MRRTVRLTERDLTRIVRRVIKESNGGCEDLCEFMYRGNCEPIGAGLNSQYATNEWYKQKKIQHPEFFNLNRDERLKQKYGTRQNMSDGDKANFWINIASLECDSPEIYEKYLNSEDPCKKTKMLS